MECLHLDSYVNMSVCVCVCICAYLPIFRGVKFAPSSDKNLQKSHLGMPSFVKV